MIIIKNHKNLRSIIRVIWLGCIISIKIEADEYAAKKYRSKSLPYPAKSSDWLVPSKPLLKNKELILEKNKPGLDRSKLILKNNKLLLEKNKPELPQNKPVLENNKPGLVPIKLINAKSLIDQALS